MADWTSLGQHRWRIQGDVLCLETIGDFSAEQMQELHFLQKEIVERYGYVLIFINNVQPGMLSPEARRVAIANNRLQDAPWSLALCGFDGARGLLARAAVVLAAQGIRLMTGRVFSMEFFSSEQQACKWLASQGQRYQATLRQTQPRRAV
jgi:hypothetical protein